MNHQNAVRVTGFNPSKSTLVWSSRRSTLQSENGQGTKYVDCGRMTWGQAKSYCEAKQIRMVYDDEDLPGKIVLRLVLA